jgi:hypothetical protein
MRAKRGSRRISVELLLVCTVLAGCGSEGGDCAATDPSCNPQPPDPDPAVIDSTTLVLEPDSAAEAGGVFTFTLSPSAPTLAVGQVIVGTQRGGFLRRVLDADTVANRLVVRTAPAALTDLVEDGGLETTTRFVLADDAPDAPLRQLRWGPARVVRATGPIVVRNGEIVLDGTTLVDRADVELTISRGRVRFDPDFAFALDIRSREVDTLHTSVTGLLTFDADIDLSGHRTAVDIPVFEVPLLTVAKAFYTQIGFWPVLGEARLSFTAVGQVGAEAAVTSTLGFTGNGTVTIGMAYDRRRTPSWTLLRSASTVFNEKPIQFSVPINAHTRLGIEAEVEVVLYRVVGPYLLANAGAQITRTLDVLGAEVRDVCTADLVGTAGIGVDIFDRELARFEATETLWEGTFCEFHYPLTPEADKLTLVDGDHQTGVVQTELPEPLVVRVTTADGDPIPNVPVAWTILAGGGTVTPGSASTNATGFAQATWQLGTALGEQRVSADAVGATLVFTATATESPSGPGPAKLVKEDGDNQQGLPGETLRKLSVLVQEADGSPFEGAIVDFVVREPDGGDVSPASAPSDAPGRVSTYWRLGLTEGTYHVEARVRGTSIPPAVFTATAVAGIRATRTTVLRPRRW